ncbi:MAG TPA: hypothetical protein DEQ47_05725 [Solibacterales bacterium]|nr:hypothetical protein [Bryobacterales bacterium]
MKQLIILAVLLIASEALWSQQTEGGRHLYLLAASPTIYGPVTYPADLYVIGENSKLQLVRHVVPSAEGVDFVLSSTDALIVAHPHISPTAIDIIHFDNPESVDSVTPKIGQRGIADGFVINSPGQTLIGFDLNSPPEQIPLKTSLIGIDLRESDSATRVLDPLPWKSVMNVRIEGEAGGPLEGRSPHFAGTLKKDGWVRNTPDGPVVLVPYSATQPAALEGRVAALRCTNDRFSIFAVGAGTHAETLMQTTSTAIVADRQLGTSRSITIRGSQSRYRLFGSWLAVLVVESAAAPKSRPGSKLQRKVATATLPSVAEDYEDAKRVMGEWLPGTLELINLNSGEFIQLNTGQSDSEILSVSGNQVLYRVDHQIFEAAITDGRLGKSVLLVDDENVSEIHWVFWSTA